MSEHLSITPNKNHKNVLVPRSSGRIEVMQLSDQIDESGRQIAYALDSDGQTAVTKAGPPEAFGDDAQAYYAHKLAMDRNPTPEQMERGEPSATIEQGSAADKLDAVVETYEGADTELLLQDARRMYRERITSAVDQFKESLPRFMSMDRQSSEQLGTYQTGIDQRLAPTVDMLSINGPITPGHIDEMIQNLQNISSNFSGQAEAVYIKRKLSASMLEEASDANVRLYSDAEEYRTVMNHLTKDIPAREPEEADRATDKSAKEALQEVVSLEQIANALSDKIPEVNGRIEEAQRDISIALGMLQQIGETFRRSGYCNPDELRYVRLKVAAVQESQPYVKQAISAIPSLAA
jgi:hypothetical protein